MVLRRYMHKRERHFAMLNDNRVVQPFDWGAEFVVEHVNGDDPRTLLAEHSRRVIENSDEYFAAPEGLEFRLETRLYPSSASLNANPPKKKPVQREVQMLTWQSAVETPSPENNTAYATYFPHEEKRTAVIVLPHWNAKAGTYFDLAKFFNKVGLSALRLTLPYHEERMPPELERADHLVAPNVGRSLQSIRQAVADTRAAVSWLKEQGYEKIGIVGTSIGSCVAFMAFVHDLRIEAAVFNHVSGYMADVVWHGLSTYHVRKSFGNNISLEELREYWLPVSPMAYMEKLAALPPRPQRYIYTKYDLSFPIDLSLETMDALRRHNIEHSEVSLPCGHYTLGEKPWVYLDGFKIISYLRKYLR
ncbi:MAG: alpha/beta hydrolase family protein [Pyrinomonadaceae bacterium]